MSFVENLLKTSTFFFIFYSLYMFKEGEVQLRYIENGCLTSKATKPWIMWHLVVSSRWGVERLRLIQWAVIVLQQKKKVNELLAEAKSILQSLTKIHAKLKFDIDYRGYENYPVFRCSFCNRLLRGVKIVYIPVTWFYFIFDKF